MQSRIKHVMENRVNYYNIIKRAISFDRSKYPRVILISMPKSGTHLIERPLLELGFVKKFFVYYQTADLGNDEDTIPVGIVSPRMRSYKEVRDLFSKVKTKEFALGHLPYSDKAYSLLDELNFKKILILRDPRDVVVSQFFWINNPAHPFYSYISKIENPEEQLMVCIKGWSSEKIGSSNSLFLGIADKIKMILPWISDPHCLVVRFEDLIGPRGSGNVENQKSTLRKICTHLNLSLSDEKIENVAARVFNTSSKTFREGRIAGWKKHFTSLHVDEFKASAGSFLIDLGYEKNFNW